MSSYTEELTKQIIAEYLENPCRETVDAIAAKTGKPARSIIAKLASAGVYQSPVRTTKTGDAIVKKEELVADIEKWLSISAPTLAKTGKLELKALHAAIKELVNDEDEDPAV